jgi:hypothetical protein
MVLRSFGEETAPYHRRRHSSVRYRTDIRGPGGGVTAGGI